MSAPRVVGLDLSITATGVAYGDGYGTTRLVKPAEIGDARLVALATVVREVGAGAALVVIEDVPPVRANAIKVLGMVHGAVRLELHRMRVRYAVVPPATLKKYATGRGGATKADMAVASFKRAQVEFVDDNQCDAWWLRAMGLDHLGAPIVTLPAAHRESLLRVRWPRRLPHEEPVMP